MLISFTDHLKFNYNNKTFLKQTADMKKIKIARIVTVPFTFISLLGLLDSLSADEYFELHIISGHDPFEQVLRDRYPMVKYHSINISRKVELINDLKAILQLMKLFLSERFTIVHSHTPKAGVLSAVAGFLTRIPVRMHTFTGQVWVEYEGKKRSFFKFLDNLICLLNTHNYVDSPSQRLFLLDNGIGVPEKMSVLHKGSIAGVNMEKFDPERVKEASKKLRDKMFPGFQGKVILYLGRINNDKGLLELGYAFFELKKQHEIKLLIVGPEEKVSPEMEDMLKKIKADPDVQFVGFVSNVEEFYSACDIFCLPSYREGCPTSILEASAMIKPVVASDIYGISDIAIDGETALVFKVKNKIDLTDKLNKVLSDEKLAADLGNGGRQFVLRDFTEKLLTKIMRDEYLKFAGLNK